MERAPIGALSMSACPIHWPGFTPPRWPGITPALTQIRSLLLERGHVVAQGRARLAVALAELLDGEKRVLADRIHELIVDMRRQWVALDERIKAFDTEFAAAAKAQDGAKRLLSIPGIGALNATALVAAVGDAGTFARGRDLAAWLGLVPRQVTTGGRPKLLGITKRGSKYLRKMLIQGARAALPTLKAADTPVGAWLRAPRPGASEHGRRRPGGQDGPHRVGAAAARGHLQGCRPGGLKSDRSAQTSVSPRCLWVATRRWPDCQPVFWNPWLKNGTRCRPLYEDQNARLSILANGSPEGRIRLCRQIKPDTEKPLADGAGHTFFG